MAKIHFRRLTPQSLKKLEGECISLLTRFGCSEDAGHCILLLLTDSERVMLGRRIAIARMLMMGKTYNEIREELHVGLTTIRPVHLWLHQMLPEYHAILSEQVKAAKKNAPLLPYTLRWFLRRYPNRHLLINMLLGDE